MGSTGHRLTSRHVGDQFQLTVVLPRSYAKDSTRRFPVIYVTDGNSLGPVALGGLFALYALTERPALFNRYVAISPSLWWNQRVMLDRLKALGQSPEIAAARLFVSVGLSEGNDAPYSMVGNIQELEAILRSRRDEGPTWHVQYFPDETHSSSWPGAMSRGLRYAFGIWPPKAGAGRE